MLLAALLPTQACGPTESSSPTVWTAARKVTAIRVIRPAAPAH